MKINRNYVAVKDNEVVLEGGLPKFAPETLSTASTTYINPSAEIYAQYGFLPYTEDPPGSPDPGYHWAPDGYGVSDGRAYRKWKQVANPPPALEDFDRAMEDHLVRERSERGYTTREPDSYLTSSVPRWKQDAEDWVAHRDAVMEYALQVMNDYASTGIAPTMDEFKAGLPRIVWTYGLEFEDPIVVPDPEPDFISELDSSDSPELDEGDDEEGDDESGSEMIE